MEQSQDVKIPSEKVEDCLIIVNDLSRHWPSSECISPSLYISDSTCHCSSVRSTCLSDEECTYMLCVLCFTLYVTCSILYMCISVCHTSSIHMIWYHGFTIHHSNISPLFFCFHHPWTTLSFKNNSKVCLIATQLWHFILCSFKGILKGRLTGRAKVSSKVSIKYMRLYVTCMTCRFTIYIYVLVTSTLKPCSERNVN